MSVERGILQARSRVSRWNASTSPLGNPIMRNIAVIMAIVRCVSLYAAEDDILPKTRAKLAAHEPAKIVCLGDSVTGIYYHTGGLRAYPEMIGVGLKLLDPESKITVINAGISGNSTADALNRLEKDVLDHKPDLVTVMFGLNDIVRVPKPDFQANLKTILERCRGGGAEVMLCTENGIFETPGRPIAKLEEYNQAMKEVGEQTQTPFCDVYAAYQLVKAADPLGFRLLCSDPFHPNMDGHKLNAETIVKSLTGKTASLTDVGPLEPTLGKTRKLLEAKQPVRVYAMTPVDQWIEPALKAKYPEAAIEVSPWETNKQTLQQLHQSAIGVRKLSPKPDLVVVAIPLEVTPPLSDPPELDIDNHSWVLNFSLSFGVQEWDVLCITPSVWQPELSDTEWSREKFSRRMIFAQDLPMVTRPDDSTDDPQTILTKWFAK